MHDTKILPEIAERASPVVGYRSDIDGLRALAVLPVVLFHMGSTFFSGGFVGVDVFFVISGYLITSAIIRDIDSGRFSLITFYERRARRIMPALFATMLGTFAIGTAILMPDELRDLGISFVGASLSISNILFWQQTDYFAAAVELKPLIHTWSLGVEEQFYVIFPLALFALSKVAKGKINIAVAIAAGVSFALSVALLHSHPSGNYYLLPSRAWELLIGSILALGAIPSVSKTVAECVAVLGLAAIALSSIFLSSESPFPGPNAMWPCLGAAALIHANSNGQTIVGRFLSCRPFVWVGLISYSLYLVHWPLIVFSNYYLLRAPILGEKALMLAAMFALAWLSWRFVERPFRKRQTVSQRAIFVGSGTGVAAFAVLGAVLFATKGLPQRFPNVQAPDTEANAERNSERPCFLKQGYGDWNGVNCRISDGAGSPVLLWGDSHANHYRGAISRIDPALRHSIILYANAGCLPILNVTIASREHCRSNNDHVLDIIKSHNIKKVVLAGYWEYNLKKNGLSVRDVARSVSKLRSLGLIVMIIGDNPDFPVANPEYLAMRLRQRALPNADFYLPIRNTEEVNKKLSDVAGKGAFFNPMTSLCRGDECLAYRNGRALMVDNAHLSGYGAHIVLGRMRTFLDRPD